ncbi:extracellular solute-binding protein [uncultured Cetobacterium sp.]|uniref:ABC transporter substrate-binding protein n=1 Tax=uncultured Cetobacterium sp. TaxID=527638 RepID=UPI0025FBC809|nr:extracellular solute-binding protein [uncultured Cetobacterium sp.]
MKFNKIVSIISLMMMTFFLIACKGKDDKSISTDNGSNKIIVWTFNEDLKYMAEKYKEIYKDKEVEVVIIEANDYFIKTNSALRGRSTVPDILVGEADWIIPFYEAGYFEDLSSSPYNADDFKDKIIDYVYEVGLDKDKTVRALAYQTTPGGIYYRRDLAKKVWGNDDPEFVGQKFSSLSEIKKTATELNNYGIKIFPDMGSLRYFSMGENRDAWVIDNDVTLSENRLNYFDITKGIYDNKEVAFASEWSPGWYAGMNGSIPYNANGKEEMVDVFGYSLPTWGMIFFRNSGKDMAGNWGITTGPNPYIWGGTFIGINKYSKNKKSAWEFLKFVTLNEDTLTWWSKSRGDVVAYLPVLEKMEDEENGYLGGQKTYKFWTEQAQKVDYSKVTKYDREIEKYFIQAVGAYQEGKMTKEKAIREFYRNVKTIYPELNVPNNKQ